MIIKIEDIPKCKVVYLRTVGPYGSQKNCQMMRDFKQWIKHDDLIHERQKYGSNGIAQDNPIYREEEGEDRIVDF
ncbi:GyrI-like domain-containing protein [Terribacillus sp. 179-K 1B1 HS]|uniref:GyrI-like domain-containing protein n=1 Tax=Terribacillus sp. 179-K 1B1 HS TaxID=3142388 RepID=UPI0039A2DB8E